MELKKWAKEWCKENDLEITDEEQSEHYYRLMDWFAMSTLKDAFTIHNASSDWEQKLVGRNIHSVFTWCKDCGMKGCNIPFEDDCGNCGSKNTVRYYDKETINLLF